MTITEPTFDESIATIEALLDAATPERWEWARYTGDSLRDAQRILTEAAAFAPDNHTVWGVIATETGSGKEKIVAFTGNGPTSEANARLLASAPDAIRWLLAQVSRPRPAAQEQAR